MRRWDASCSRWLRTSCRSICCFAAADQDTSALVWTAGATSRGTDLSSYLTDLDRSPCPSGLIRAWLGKRQHPDNLLLRIAVREIAAWLLADHDGMRHLLGSKGRLPEDPDALPDAKQHLLRLARHAPRHVRQELIAERGAIAAQGIAYNTRLCGFVAANWDPDGASARSESLRRTRMRIAELAVRAHGK